MLYDEFKPIVDLLFNNWTALQLAVEHGMGAPGGQQTAQLMSVYIARYCVENVVDVDDLADVLDHLIDEEFDTTCRDGSPQEIATLLLLYLDLLKEGQYDELQARLEALPKCQKWLSVPMHESVPPQCHGNPNDDSTSSSEEDDDVNHQNANAASSSQPNNQPVPMDEDVEPGWTVVKTRRKK